MSDDIAGRCQDLYEFVCLKFHIYSTYVYIKEEQRNEIWIAISFSEHDLNKKFYWKLNINIYVFIQKQSVSRRLSVKIEATAKTNFKTGLHESQTDVAIKRNINLLV